MEAFPTLQEHQHNLNACVQMDEIREELLTFLVQNPCALFYCGNVDKQMNMFYQRNLRKTQKITLSTELNTADGTSMPNVFLCVLRGEYGHLSSIVSKSFYLYFLRLLKGHQLSNSWSPI